MKDDIRERVAEAIWRVTDTGVPYWNQAKFQEMADAAIAAYEAARPDVLCAYVDPLGKRCGHESRYHIEAPMWCTVCQATPDPVGAQFYHDFLEARPTEPDPATIERMARALARAYWDEGDEAPSDLALAAWRAEHGGSR